MINGVFYNSPKSQCSIYESGLMIYDVLKQSKKYVLRYTENRSLDFATDFSIFNYHPHVNSWMGHGVLKHYLGRTFAVILEVGHHGDLLPNTSRVFQKYMVIDPTIKDTDTIFGFPRPIERYTPRPYNAPEITVGSFGFATPGKRWVEILEVVSDEFDEALIRINIPFATFVPDCQREIDKVVVELKSFKLKSGIHLELTHNYMDKHELIEWCGQNTINFFPYYRDLAGLAAVTDQAISARRPLLVTNNPAFRHITKYIKPLSSDNNLVDAINKSLSGVIRMYEDWSPETFYQKFEGIL